MLLWCIMLKPLPEQRSWTFFQNKRQFKTLLTEWEFMVDIFKDGFVISANKYEEMDCNNKIYVNCRTEYHQSQQRQSTISMIRRNRETMIELNLCNEKVLKRCVSRANKNKSCTGIAKRHSTLNELKNGTAKTVKCKNWNWAELSWAFGFQAQQKIIQSKDKSWMKWHITSKRGYEKGTKQKGIENFALISVLNSQISGNSKCRSRSMWMALNVNVHQKQKPIITIQVCAMKHNIKHSINVFFADFITW